MLVQRLPLGILTVLGIVHLSVVVLVHIVPHRFIGRPVVLFRFGNRFSGVCRGFGLRFFQHIRLYFVRDILKIAAFIRISREFRLGFRSINGFVQIERIPRFFKVQIGFDVSEIIRFYAVGRKIQFAAGIGQHLLRGKVRVQIRKIGIVKAFKVIIDGTGGEIRIVKTAARKIVRSDIV